MQCMHTCTRKSYRLCHTNIQCNVRYHSQQTTTSQEEHSAENIYDDPVRLYPTILIMYIHVATLKKLIIVTLCLCVASQIFSLF